MLAAHCGTGATKKEGQKLISDWKMIQLKYAERNDSKKELVMFFA